MAPTSSTAPPQRIAPVRAAALVFISRSSSKLPLRNSVRSWMRGMARREGSPTWGGMLKIVNQSVYVFGTQAQIGHLHLLVLRVQTLCHGIIAGQHLVGVAIMRASHLRSRCLVTPSRSGPTASP